MYEMPRFGTQCLLCQEKISWARCGQLGNAAMANPRYDGGVSRLPGEALDPPAGMRDRAMDAVETDMTWTQRDEREVQVRDEVPEGGDVAPGDADR